MKGVNAVLIPVCALEYRLFLLAMAKLGGNVKDFTSLETRPALQRSKLRISACQYRNRGGGEWKFGYPRLYYGECLGPR